VRDGLPPRIIRVESEPTLRVSALAAAATTAVQDWVVEEGRSAVIVPEELREPVAHAMAHALGHALVGAGAAALDSRVSVLTVPEVKGLEFDQVVVAEPADLMEGAARGGHDLYVALTRATRELVVVHARPLPAGFPEPSA
jgi:superfamily I DNA/RNA helicase